MRLVVLGGFLGSGKTSILMPLAQQLNAAGDQGKKTRVAIIENEIGSVGIDSVYTDGQDFTSRELFGGCICCSMVSNLLDCLAQLEKKENPDWVILEATGLARPHDIASSVWEYYDENMSITSLIIIDGSRWLRLSKAVGELVYDQIENGNYILLNKVDLINEDVQKETIADIESKSDAKIYALSAKQEPERTAEICREIIDEIVSREA